MGVVLLAEDSKTIRTVCQWILKGTQHELLAVSSGNEALRVVGQRRPDLIVLDYTLPDHDSYELCRSIKSDPGMAGIPVLMLGGNYASFDEARASANGADGSLDKPFKSDAFLSQVDELLAQAAAGNVVSLAAPAVTPTPPPAAPAEPPPAQAQGGSKPRFQFPSRGGGQSKRRFSFPAGGSRSASPAPQHPPAGASSHATPPHGQPSVGRAASPPPSLPPQSHTPLPRSGSPGAQHGPARRAFFWRTGGRHRPGAGESRGACRGQRDVARHRAHRAP